MRNKTKYPSGQVKKHIPKGKHDDKAVEYLKDLPVDMVMKDVPALLTWLQDLHWDAAQGIGEYFIPYVNDIKTELIAILNGFDTEWKYNIMVAIIAKSPHRINEEITAVLKKIAKHPTPVERDEGLDILANEITIKSTIN